MGPLISADSNKVSSFKNVARHNGFEAWRQIAMPINKDKILILQELLPLITNPKSASDIHHYDDALRAVLRFVFGGLAVAETHHDEERVE